MGTLGVQQFNIHEQSVKENGDSARFHGDSSYYSSRNQRYESLLVFREKIQNGQHMPAAPFAESRMNPVESKDSDRTLGDT